MMSSNEGGCERLRPNLITCSIKNGAHIAAWKADIDAGDVERMRSIYVDWALRAPGRLEIMFA